MMMVILVHLLLLVPITARGNVGGGGSIMMVGSCKVGRRSKKNIIIK